MFKYFDEFYKAAIYHFIVSASCAALFALGLEYSQGEDGDDVIDYYIPSMVLSVLQFSLSIVTLLLFALSKGCRIAVDSYGSWSRKSYHRLKAMHVIITIVSFIWGIVGAILTATSGVCKKEEKCSYAVNMKINRAFAITMVVLHMLNVGVSYLFLKTKRSKSRTDPLDVTIIKRKGTQAPKLALKVNIEQTKNKESARKENIEQTKNKEASQFVLKPRRVKRTMSDISRGNRHTGKYYDDSLLRRQIITTSPLVDDNHGDNPKPLPKTNKKLLFPVVGKVVFHYTTQKNKNDAISSQEPRVPSVPAPSYNDVISGDANTNPYWLPPLPVDHREMHTLPDNMYIGNVYPDTEIVAIKPHEVSRR